MQLSALGDFAGVEEEVKKRSPAPSIASSGGKSVQWSDWMTCFSADGTFEFQKEGSPIAKEVEMVQPEEEGDLSCDASSDCSSFDYAIPEPWDDVDLLHVPILPGTWGAAFSTALWYMGGSQCGGCQECKRNCGYLWEKIGELGWDSLMWDTTAS